MAEDGARVYFFQEEKGLGFVLDGADIAVVSSFDAFVFAELEQFHVLHAFADLFFDLVAEFRIVLEEQAGVFAALTDPLVVVAEPGTAFLDDFPDIRQSRQLYMSRSSR